MISYSRGVSARLQRPRVEDPTETLDVGDVKISYPAVKVCYYLVILPEYEHVNDP